MLPFGMTIPATVPQGSEIPEVLMNNPVHSFGLIRRVKFFWEKFCSLTCYCKLCNWKTSKQISLINSCTTLFISNQIGPWKDFFFAASIFSTCYNSICNCESLQWYLNWDCLIYGRLFYLHKSLCRYLLIGMWQWNGWNHFGYSHL